MTGLILTCLAAIVAPLASGLALVSALGETGFRRPRCETLATAYVLGYGWIGGILVALAAAGLPLTLYLAWPAALAPLLLLLWFPGRSRETTAGTRAPDTPGFCALSAGKKVLLGMVAALAVFYFLRALPDCFITPLKRHDAVGIWALKSKALYHDRGLDAAFFTLDRDAPMHPDYPLIQPMHGAWLLLNSGEVDERILKAPFPLFWICLIVFLHRFLRPRTGPVLSLSLAVAFAFIDWGYQHALVVTADLVLAVLAFRAVTALIRYLEEGDRGELRLSAVLAALCAGVKNEGWAVVAACIVVVLIFRVRTRIRGRLGLALGLGATAVAVNLPWLLFRWRHGLYTDLFHGKFFLGYAPDTGPPPGIGRLGFLLARALEAAGIRTDALEHLAQAEAGLKTYVEILAWDGFWVLAGIMVVLLGVRFRAVPLAVRALLVYMGVLGAAYVTALCFSPHDIHWHAETAWPRLLLHLAPAALAVIALIPGAFLNASRHPTMGTMDPRPKSP